MIKYLQGFYLPTLFRLRKKILIFSNTFNLLFSSSYALEVPTISWSGTVFYPFGELFAIFMKFKIVVCKLFQFGKA